jgi:hypothetical protein
MGGKPIHALARCQTCGKEFDSLNAQGLAAQHAYKYGHYVVGEIAYGFQYGEKP